jgi:hypothetical protein
MHTQPPKPAARRRWLGLAASVLITLAALEGCSSASGQSPPSTSVSTSSSTSTESVATPVATTSDVLASPSPSSTDDSTSDPGSTSTPGPTVLSGAERTLGLADAFNPASSWEEKNYTPVGSKTQVQAIGVTVHCNEDQPDLLEFRFSGTDGFKLKVFVAQDLFSPEAAGQVQFTLRVDGRQVATRTIKLKESAELDTDLTGVAVVQLEAAQLTDQNRGCGKESTALITKLLMTSS